MGARDEDDDLIAEWDDDQPFRTARDLRPAPEDTSPHQTLAYAAGREAGWAECALAYGKAIEKDVLLSGGRPSDAKRIRRWFDSKVRDQG